MEYYRSSASVWPLLMEILCSQPDLTYDFDNLCKVVEQRLMLHGCNTIELRKFVAHALVEGQKLGLVTLELGKSKSDVDWSEKNMTVADEEMAILNDDLRSDDLSATGLVLSCSNPNVAAEYTAKELSKNPTNAFNLRNIIGNAVYKVRPNLAGFNYNLPKISASMQHQNSLTDKALKSRGVRKSKRTTTKRSAIKKHRKKPAKRRNIRNAVRRKSARKNRPRTQIRKKRSAKRRKK